MSSSSSSSSCEEIYASGPPNYVGEVSGKEYNIAQGSGYGLVQMCMDCRGEIFAIKIKRGCRCKREIRVLKTAAQLKFSHFANFIDSGHCSRTNQSFLVMELLGENLEQLMMHQAVLRSSSFGGFSDCTWLRVASQTLNAIEELHCCGFLSRDIKAENFVCGRLYPFTGIIYIIDFDLSVRYLHEDGTPRLFKDSTGKAFIGSIHFCSLAQHEGKAPNRMDDIEAWFYTVLYLLDGDLAWLSFDRLDSKKIYQSKSALRQKLNISRRFPKLLAQILKWIDAADPEASVNYQEIYSILEREMKRRNITTYGWDKLDWEVHQNK